jgi:uncharacterized protein involved in exopolysaccharide biosynthesis
VLLVSDTDKGLSSSNMPNISSVASLAGINLTSSGGVSKTNLAIQIIKSRDFFAHLVSDDAVLLNLASIESYNSLTKKTEFVKNIYDFESKKWLRDINGISQKPNFLKTYEDYLFTLSIGHNKKTGFLNLSFQHPSPIFAKDFINLIIDELNIIMKDKDLNQSEKAIEYLSEQLNKNSYMKIDKSISNMIESNLYTNMMASIDSEYFLKVIDQPYEPQFKIAPVRWLICILGTISGFILSLLLSLFLGYSHLIFKKVRLHRYE